MGWFLYDNDHRHERVKNILTHFMPSAMGLKQPSEVLCEKLFLETS